MAERSIDFSIQAAILDKFIHLPTPEKDPVATDIVLERIRKNVDLRRYFFAQNPSSGWAKVLLRKGFIKNPPNVIKTDVGYQFPSWEVSSYLATVAAEIQDVVDQVIEDVETDNPVIHTDLLNALSKCDAILTTKHKNKIVNWINSDYQWWGFAESLSNLLLYLVEKKYVSESMDFLRLMLEPLPSKTKSYGDFYLGGEAKSKYQLESIRSDFWAETIITIGVIVPKELVEVLESTLLDAIQIEIESRKRKYDDNDWLTYGWRSSIASSSQDRYESYKDILLIALRDVFNEWINRANADARSMVLQYLSRKEVILRRLGIYLVANHPDVYEDIARDLLQITSTHQDIKIHNEYFILLREVVPILQVEEQAIIYKIILNGPDTQITNRLAERAANERGEDAIVYAKRHRDIWIRDRLWMIQSSLPEDVARKFQNLCDEYGIPEHPEFLIWSGSSEAYWMKDVSPLSSEELYQVPPGDLLDYLKTWKPDPLEKFSTEEITLSGLADTTASILLEYPNRYKDIFIRLIEAPPSVSISVFKLASERVKNKVEVPWGVLLQLTRSHANIIYSKNPDRWSDDNYEARISAIHLIHDALSLDIEFSEDIISEIENIITIYLSDPDPNITRDNPPEGGLGHEDPLTNAINSIRSIAMMCLMRLLKYKYQKWKEEFGTNGNSEESSLEQLLPPRLFFILNQKLDKSTDPSWVLHTVYGQYLRLLAVVDWKWLFENIHKIFPTNGDEENNRYFVAAWEAYVIFNNPYRKLIDALRLRYTFAIRLLGDGISLKTHLDYINRLSSHILLDYLWTPYEISGENAKSSLLRLFFSLLDVTSRGRAIWTLWRMIQTIPENELLDHWNNIKKIWNWRLNEASLSNLPKEFEDEMEELSHLPLLAPESETILSLWYFIEPLIPYSDNLRVWRNLEEYLAQQVLEAPEEVIRFYLLMHERSPEPDTGYRGSTEYSDTIINTAVRKLESRRNALKVMDIKFRRGDRRYRQTYLQYT